MDVPTVLVAICSLASVTVGGKDALWHISPRSHSFYFMLAEDF